MSDPILDFPVGTHVVYRGNKGTHLGVVEKAESNNDIGVVSGGSKVGVPVLHVRTTTGEVIMTGPHRLTVAHLPDQSEVTFAPAASMRATVDGWVLEIDFGDSANGGVLGGVVVDEHPDMAKAAGALDGWLKRVGAEKSVLTLRLRPPRPERFTQERIREELLRQAPRDYTLEEIDGIVEAVLAGTHPDLEQSVARAISGLDA